MSAVTDDVIDDVIKLLPLALVVDPFKAFDRALQL